MLNRHGPIEQFPVGVLSGHREEALLFKQLATLRTDAKLFRKVDALRWKGPTKSFDAWAQGIGEPGLAKRAWAAKRMVDERA